MASKGRILIVEDDENLRIALEDNLDDEGYEVASVTDGKAALQTLERGEHDLVILDLMLPDVDGYHVCRKIRERGWPLRVLMLTARTLEEDVVRGFEVGADDYLAKPYRLRELVARMRAVLRRSDVNGSSLVLAPGIIEVGDVRLDPEEHRVSLEGVDLALPLKEFELLHLLLANAGRVLPRETLIDRVWGNDYVGDTKTLDVHVKRLRSKIEPDPAAPTRIITIRGLGYKYERA